MDEVMIKNMVKEILNNIEKHDSGKKDSSGKIGVSSYPLGSRRPDLVRTPTNKTLDDITLENVMNGKITIEDLNITADTLELQAQVAEDAGRSSIARNFRRAAELTTIPDDRILQIYNSLRPFRSTKAELLQIADELENKYGALINAALVREAAEVYEKRKKLRSDD
ncbi:Propanediol dehydratase small subunit [Sebaldella termitidis]|uniref:Dehydratase small subunit n=1 Tax=Sebaldella termitidis (strain ATCC 33386 / NCTC 11300) TaxID=526218 RepID=D1AFL6_SEBTE|nr:diol dehydratase small subunit [Sebaldella termitidis]ACZ07901.1 dehydratase small subunit [Sebaldella termitidis ATCC 33386]SUI23202.1 Propanediol dehydratase small subunit [Sebaldella termitidis]